MKTLVKNYSFDPTQKTITFSDFTSLYLEQILFVLNQSKQSLLFGGGVGSATIQGNVLQLGTVVSTTGMSTTDKLQIFLDDLQLGYGTAGTPTANVVSVQGLSGMTPIKTDGSSVTQPVSLSSLPSLSAGSNAIGSITQSGVWGVRNQDGSGNAITSQLNGAQRAIDVGVNVGGVQVDPRSIRALTSSDVVSAAQSGTWNLNNIIGSISLPTGASTDTTLTSVLNKLPSLGTAGTPSANVISIQGVANGTSITTYLASFGSTFSSTFSAGTNSSTFTLFQKFTSVIIPVIATSPTITVQVTLDAGVNWIDTSVQVAASATDIKLIESDSFARLVAFCGVSNGFRFKSSSAISATLTVRNTHA